MTDDELVAEGTKLVQVIERAQMTLGMLALEYAPIGDPSVKTGGYDRLQEYATAIGCDFGTLRNYRAVAAAWKGVDHGEHKFSLLKGLAPVHDKPGLMTALAAAPAPTKSGRWTVVAAQQFAREHGFWTPEDSPPDHVSPLRRLRSWIASVPVAELDDRQRADLLAVVDETRGDLLLLREYLTGQRVKR